MNDTLGGLTDVQANRALGRTTISRFDVSVLPLIPSHGEIDELQRYLRGPRAETAMEMTAGQIDRNMSIARMRESNFALRLQGTNHSRALSPDTRHRVASMSRSSSTPNLRESPLKNTISVTGNKEVEPSLPNSPTASIASFSRLSSPLKNRRPGTPKLRQSADEERPASSRSTPQGKPSRKSPHLSVSSVRKTFDRMRSSITSPPLSSSSPKRKNKKLHDAVLTRTSMDSSMPHIRSQTNLESSMQSYGNHLQESRSVPDLTIPSNSSSASLPLLQRARDGSVPSIATMPTLYGSEVVHSPVSYAPSDADSLSLRMFPDQNPSLNPSPDSPSTRPSTRYSSERDQARSVSHTTSPSLSPVPSQRRLDQNRNSNEILFRPYTNSEESLGLSDAQLLRRSLLGQNSFSSPNHANHAGRSRASPQLDPPNTRPESSAASSQLSEGPAFEPVPPNDPSPILAQSQTGFSSPPSPKASLSVTKEHTPTLASTPRAVRKESSADSAELSSPSLVGDSDNQITASQSPLIFDGNYKPLPNNNAPPPPVPNKDVKLAMSTPTDYSPEMQALDTPTSPPMSNQRTSHQHSTDTQQESLIVQIENAFEYIMNLASSSRSSQVEPVATHSADLTAETDFARDVNSSKNAVDMNSLNSAGESELATAMPSVDSIGSVSDDATRDAIEDMYAERSYDDLDQSTSIRRDSASSLRPDSNDDSLLSAYRTELVQHDTSLSGSVDSARAASSFQHDMHRDEVHNDSSVDQNVARQHADQTADDVNLPDTITVRSNDADYMSRNSLMRLSQHLSEAASAAESVQTHNPIYTQLEQFEEQQANLRGTIENSRAEIMELRRNLRQFRDGLQAESAAIPSSTAISSKSKSARNERAAKRLSTVENLDRRLSRMLSQSETK
ncbi:hypothetical protein MPSI1_000683 [Malassezia psittaci]|uniref:Uncharacterized protein n=1 Tax=Malassezia psittaci TaxID=1821823 RepID=A0AAF0JIW3_9BASI|nr:hypothetical protein MPSI1_000683 [Malassezia psittaci]